MFRIKAEVQRADQGFGRRIGGHLGREPLTVFVLELELRRQHVEYLEAGVEIRLDGPFT
jgi:hypothetical protein